MSCLHGKILGVTSHRKIKTLLSNNLLFHSSFEGENYLILLVKICVNYFEPYKYKFLKFYVKILSIFGS